MTDQEFERPTELMDVMKRGGGKEAVEEIGRSQTARFGDYVGEVYGMSPNGRHRRAWGTPSLKFLCGKGFGVCELRTLYCGSVLSPLDLPGVEAPKPPSSWKIPQDMLDLQGMYELTPNNLSRLLIAVPGIIKR